MAAARRSLDLAIDRLDRLQVVAFHQLGAALDAQGRKLGILGAELSAGLLQRFRGVTLCEWAIS